MLLAQLKTEREKLTAHHNKDLAHAAEERTLLLTQLKTEREELTAVTNALVTTTAEREETQRNLLTATFRADGLATQIADMQPQLDLIAEQREALTHLLDTVKDRLRRKEVQEAQAVLNRQTLAHAKPDFNRG
jgi:septal ring factor EnvC (AmiA/AmiB activator)